MSFLSRFDAYHEQAAQLTKLSDFGSIDYVVPMKLLLADYDKYCPHTPKGEILSSGGIIGLLVSRLFAHQGFKEHPKFANAGVESPIIITGMPRTGSTALQKLLAKDPGTQWLPPFLAGAPMPRPPRETWEGNSMYQAMTEGLEQIYKLVPEVRQIHPMVAGEADECRFGMGGSFWCPDAAFTGPTRGAYAEWLSGPEPQSAYQYYRQVLGLVAGGDKRQWILKDPTTHPFAPRTMLATFPDARIVYTHRDPVASMSSASAMMYWVRRWRIDGLTPEQNGRDQLAFWSPAVERLEKALSTVDPARVVHVHMKELHEDPVGTAERIYRHFKLPVTNAAKQAWHEHVAKDPRSGHGVHLHKPEESGISAADVQRAVPKYWAGYAKRYGTMMY